MRIMMNYYLKTIRFTIYTSTSLPLLINRSEQKQKMPTLSCKPILGSGRLILVESLLYHFYTPAAP